jgi:hypothetical protein
VTARASRQCGRAAIHVIVTCTSRKTLPIPPVLRLDSVPGSSTGKRARAWAHRLGTFGDMPTIEAEKLYAGEHWMIARSLQGLAAGLRMRLWVCSAGYGLIPADSWVHPYAAAFSGQADRVPGGADGARQWWHALAGWEGPEPGQPRSISMLAAADPSACIMLALSASYLNACRDDIATATAAMPDPDRLILVSAGARPHGPLSEMMVPADARLQSLLGGTRQALNARIAAHLLSAGISSRAAASDYLARLLTEQPPMPRYERKKLSDQEVSQMITLRLAQAPRTPASRMLREFRDAGYACEQQRFALLHRAVMGVRP